LIEHVCLDDLFVADEELLIRRVSRRDDTNMVVFDEGTGLPTLSSGAFGFDEDGLSVYRKRVLRCIGMTPLGAARDPQNYLVSVTASAVRGFGLGVRADPSPPDGDGHRRDVAHALVTNRHGLGKKPLLRVRKALAEQARPLQP
jgi:hypothetical protein